MESADLSSLVLSNAPGAVRRRPIITREPQRCPAGRLGPTGQVPQPQASSPTPEAPESGSSSRQRSPPPGCPYLNPREALRRAFDGPASKIGMATTSATTTLASILRTFLK